MNDGNIRYYLETEMAELKAEIKMHNDMVEGWSRNIDDAIKNVKNLRVHYTSLLNTAIAYAQEAGEDYEVEEDEQEEVEEDE